MEGTYKDHLVQLPDQFRADQKLKHAIKGVVQMSFKHSQAWGIVYLDQDSLELWIKGAHTAIGLMVFERPSIASVPHVDIQGGTALCIEPVHSKWEQLSWFNHDRQLSMT